MADKPIQEQFGEAIINAVRSFARADLEDVPAIEQNYLRHMNDPELRHILAETFYGARWIYKLGLALLVRDNEQLAHVRAQIVDYGSVCEGLLYDMIHHALTKNIMIGTKHRFSNTATLSNPISWTSGIEQNLKRQSFHWQINVAGDENIITTPLRDRLHVLRRDRNMVHLKIRTYRAFLGASMSAFQVLLDTVDQTRTWKNGHP